MKITKLFIAVVTLFVVGCETTPKPWPQEFRNLIIDGCIENDSEEPARCICDASEIERTVTLREFWNLVLLEDKESTLSQHEAEKLTNISVAVINALDRCGIDEEK